VVCSARTTVYYSSRERRSYELAGLIYLSAHVRKIKFFLNFRRYNLLYPERGLSPPPTEEAGLLADTSVHTRQDGVRSERDYAYLRLRTVSTQDAVQPQRVFVLRYSPVICCGKKLSAVEPEAKERECESSVRRCFSF